VESFAKLVQVIEDTKKDFEKASRGNKAAGTRVRKAMQQVKSLAKAVRDEILAMRTEGEAPKA
jgi:hypothetical protein